MDKVDSDKLFTDKVKIKRALISVTDKTNIKKLAKVLEDYNIEILKDGTKIKSLVVISADGSLSPLREMCKIKYFNKTYLLKVK